MTTLATNTGSGILALEDDRDDSDLLRLLLRKAGFADAIQFYRDGAQLISAFGKILRNSITAVRPLLCFLDIRSSAVNGHEVLRWIRSQRALDRLSVVMLSGSEHPRDIQEAAQAGAQCYLAKYPQPRILKQVVEDAERYSSGTPADECFCFPANLLLVRCRRLTPTRTPTAPQPTPLPRVT